MCHAANYQTLHWRWGTCCPLAFRLLLCTLFESKVYAMSDVIGLIEMGECEEEWGPDFGNGWLYRHPLGKLGMFQHFLLEE
jgi:hypothetical protein